VRGGGGGREGGRRGEEKRYGERYERFEKRKKKGRSDSLESPRIRRVYLRGPEDAKREEKGVWKKELGGRWDSGGGGCGLPRKKEISTTSKLIRGKSKISGGSICLLGKGKK